MTNHTANFVPRLSERLKLVASFVPQDSRIADIGTDHGFVPICLAKEGRIKSALAMDVRTGPLERAEAHIKEAGISDIPISTRLSDGLKELKPQEADTVIIAGMGGELEIKILQEGRHLWSTIRRFILSPQSDLEKVRRFLSEEGFLIEKEAMLREEGKYYTSHLWITGIGNIAFECSFTVPKGGSVKEAEEVIATLEIRKEGEKYPAELIPVRLSEIYQINESYEWVVSTVKEELKKDFQGVEDDLEKLQQVIDSGKIGPKKKDEWLAIGITVCTILANEVEGMEWKTLIDGNREAPVLDYKDRIIDPMKIAWSKVKAGQPCNVIEEYKSLIINY